MTANVRSRINGLATAALIAAVAITVAGCDDFDESREAGITFANLIAEGDEKALREVSSQTLREGLDEPAGQEQLELADEYLDPSMEWDLLGWNSSTSGMSGETSAHATGTLVQTDEARSTCRSIVSHGFSDPDEPSIEMVVRRPMGEEDFVLDDFAVHPPP